uniref:Uncharacterized protein n=1 Tax=Caenorhabditis japonica TaxID=281687 RepID=A0A8R1EW13_CAEJA
MAELLETLRKIISNCVIKKSTRNAISGVSMMKFALLEETEAVRQLDKSDSQTVRNNAEFSKLRVKYDN